MDREQRCLGIEREGDLPSKDIHSCLVNFKDKFVILFGNSGSLRYSPAEDKWEDLPSISTENNADSACSFGKNNASSACSLGDKFYVLFTESRIIKVLHNPDAPVSSQQMHWQKIEVPGDIPIPLFSPVFTPLNSTEIVITGGAGKGGSKVEDILIFDTTTCEFKKEVVNTDGFMCYSN